MLTFTYRHLLGNIMDTQLLDIIACPICKGKLVYQRKRAELWCHLDALAFPIKKEIPVLIEKEARQLSQQEVDNEF